MKLLWLDMEMTGLEVEKERIIEVACIVTDKDFNEIDTYHAIVKQDPKFLEAMDDWNQKQHGGSGLKDKVKDGKEESLVEKEVLTFIDKHWKKKDRPILAGNSIHQDRKFIHAYWKDLEMRLHYRMLDVSAFKVILENWYGKKYKKKDSHRALDDIRESILEMKYYKNFIVIDDKN